MKVSVEVIGQDDSDDALADSTQPKSAHPGRADGGDSDMEQAADLGPSKSAIKREHRALQDLAEQLLHLPRAELETLELDAKTWEAIDETARIKDKRALARHYKRIANCLARLDQEPLKALLDKREQAERAAKARHHQLERWRERLIAEGDAALGEFLTQHPHAERQPLRALIRSAQRDAERGKPDGPRKLFRYLRDSVQLASDP
ncbi:MULTISPECIES: ribosome biogenesis factor YjgA [Thiorhodovibrio]|uniref:ribosome biogenesis factor YjgA n=1 Tax=Thiorhodovibrio TaxID=61593 RepID=UPI002B257BEA|nr:ribosome biogenesis factor YjgA [Thiorhodovibrio litoralis]WPL11393.1 x96 protein [Thiorhodovibrio litoralis]